MCEGFDAPDRRLRLRFVHGERALGSVSCRQASAVRIG